MIAAHNGQRSRISSRSRYYNGPTNAYENLDPILPTQIAETRQLSSEARLLMALLEGAYWDLISYPPAQPLHRDARAWIEANATAWGSFRFVCDVLAIDPDYIRAGLLAQANASTRHRRRYQVMG